MSGELAAFSLRAVNPFVCNLFRCGTLPAFMCGVGHGDESSGEQPSVGRDGEPSTVDVGSDKPGSGADSANYCQHPGSQAAHLEGGVTRVTNSTGFHQGKRVKSQPSHQQMGHL